MSRMSQSSSGSQKYNILTVSDDFMYTETRRTQFRVGLSPLHFLCVSSVLGLVSECNDVSSVHNVYHVYMVYIDKLHTFVYNA